VKQSRKERIETFCGTAGRNVRQKVSRETAERDKRKKFHAKQPSEIKEKVSRETNWSCFT
jgi:hypothetical protein